MTPRQSQVLTEVCKGKSNKEVARTLDISEATVKLHLTSVFEHLGVQTRWQAIAHMHSIELKAARQGTIEECAKTLETDAKLCDCFAFEERECGCGAWCEWKSITSARAVEIVRTLLQDS